MPRIILISITLAFCLTSCEAVFTTSLVEWAQRDPSKLSQSQKVAYAQDALSSGDRNSMKKAYEALKTTTDPTLKPLVAELAVGGAGVKDALTTVLGKVAAGGEEEDIKQALQDAYSSFSAADLELLQNAAALIASAEEGGATISADQYFMVGVGLLVVAMNEAGGDVNQIDTGAGAGQLAIEFLTKAKDSFPPESEAAKLLNDFSGYF